MKNLTLVFLVFQLLTFFNIDKSLAQTSNVDQRIIDAYGIERVNDLKEKSPELLDYLTYKLDYSYEIKEQIYNEDEKIIKVSDVDMIGKNENNAIRPTFDINSFNILLYNFKRDRELKKVYRIDNTNKVIVFYSEEEVAKAYNLKQTK